MISPSYGGFMSMAALAFHPGVEEAETLLNQANRRDPTYARAHAALASVYLNQAEQRDAPVQALWGRRERRWSAPWSWSRPWPSATHS